MRRTIHSFALASCVGLAACAGGTKHDAVRVILVGDSTMATVTGYGDALCARLDARTDCENLARNGRSSKSYRVEGFWEHVTGRLHEGGARTFVLIQFGHNDQPGKAERSTTLAEFQANMRRYVDEVRAAGAEPVLVTPLTRRAFKNGQLVDDLAPWAEATRAVAAASHTALLDLNADSRRAVTAMGAVQAVALAELPAPAAALAAAATGTTIDVQKPPPALHGGHVSAFDYTHLGAAGAALFSALVADEIRRSVPALAAHLSEANR